MEEQMRVVVKRKLDCCDQNAERQKKMKRKATIQCDYCQCVFYQRLNRDGHITVHECSQCHDIAIGDDARTHNIQHQRELQLEQLKEQRQRQMNDDFVLCYIRANRLHQYRPQLDYEPDFDFIMINYQFKKEEWLAFFKKFKRRFLDLFFGGSHYSNWRQQVYLKQQWNTEVISYLLDHGVLSVCGAIDFLNIFMVNVKYIDYVLVIVSFLLKKDCKIKAEWAAKVINDDELIERIKMKHTFTFDEIHKARQWDTLSPFDINGLKRFYCQLQKHFFNPNFENPFDDFDDEDFKFERKYKATNRSLYNSDSYEEEIAEMPEKSLADLIKEYIKEMKVYAELDKKCGRLIGERDRKIRASRKNVERERIWQQYDHEIEQKLEPEQDEQGDVVSVLYYAISMK